MITPARYAEFERLFHEFIQDYAATDAGQRHAASYATSRASGQANFDAITERAHSGADITDDLLRTLLPHADTATNRESGAWIHVAPVFTTDVRTKYEANGWIRPGDWPAVAQAVWHFVMRCATHPEQLADACHALDALPFVKGFQTATLTPILNALRPDDFVLVNNKVLRTLRYFGNVACSQSLVDYPAANAALHQLVASLTKLLQDSIPNVRTDDLFNMFSHWLVSVKRFNFAESQEKNVRYWRISPGEQSWRWAEWREDGYIAMAWGELEDVSSMTRSQFEARRDELARRHYDLTKVGAEQVWKFARQLRRGDRVLVNHGTRAILGIGTISGPYTYLPDADQGHRYAVMWDDLTQRAVYQPSWRRQLDEIDETTFRQSSQAPAVQSLPELRVRVDEATPQDKTKPPELSARRHMMLAEAGVSYAAVMEPEPAEPTPADGTTIQPPYALSDCAQASGVDEELLARWVRTIERKGQLIFYGPPGTGKTFLAEQLARHLVGGTESNAGDGFWELVQFHPAYAYEDFVQGIRPQSGAEGLSYPVVPGRFLEFCQRAERCRGRCVLIIDEINRANLAQVFGELMYLLEYRERQVTLAANGDSFYIPANVRIIGTMNTADRSIALVDHALRRRFAFIALHPNYAVLRRFHERLQTGFPVEPLIQLLSRINQEIADPHYELGISFFLRTNLPEELADIWQMEIEPYLEEYFFDQPDRVEALRWEKVQTLIPNPSPTRGDGNKRPSLSQLEREASGEI